MHGELESLEPSNALKMYLRDRDGEVSEATKYSHKKRLEKFVNWCEENGLDDLNDVSGRDLHRFRLWRKKGDKTERIADETLRSAMSTLRVFLRWCVDVDAVHPDVPEKVAIPEYGNRESRDEMLDADHAEAILDYLGKYQYASVEHVIIRLMWRTGMRIGAVRALDVDDYSADDQSLKLRHRPETETPLKNGESAERYVSISERTCHVLDAYLQGHRDKVTDEYGREPLVTSAQGRRTRTSIRRTTYYWTCPCRVNLACPHGRDPEDCDATEWANASECPSSVSPHPVRRGAITEFLREDVPEQVVSDRMDVSPDVLEMHYDQRSSREKMEQRRQYIPQG